MTTPPVPAPKAPDFRPTPRPRSRRRSAGRGPLLPLDVAVMAGLAHRLMVRRIDEERPISFECHAMVDDGRRLGRRSIRQTPLAKRLTGKLRLAGMLPRRGLIPSAPGLGLTAPGVVLPIPFAFASRCRGTEGRRKGRHYITTSIANEKTRRLWHRVSDLIYRDQY